MYELYRVNLGFLIIAQYIWENNPAEIRERYTSPAAFEAPFYLFIFLFIINLTLLFATMQRLSLELAS